MFGEIESAETEDVKKPKKHKVAGKGKGKKHAKKHGKKKHGGKKKISAKGEGKWPSGKRQSGVT